MTEEKKLRQSYGSFDLVGTITVIPNETFQVDLKGKNNTNFNYSRINMKMEDGNGGIFYLNAMDGFDKVKGRTIYAGIKDSTTNEQMQISFADRFNEAILEHIDPRSFVGVALTKEDNGEGRKVWKYNNFLALYDAINFIKDRFETGMKVRVTGRTRYSMYNDNLQTEYQIGNIFLLSDEDFYSEENKYGVNMGFTFRQDVILREDSVDMSEWEEKSIAKVNAEVLMRIKQQDNLFKLPLVVRATDEKDKALRERVIEKFLKVDSGKVRRIKLEGTYNTGYSSGQINENELPEEALELIELGLYDKEEVLRMYVKRDRVDELLINRPVVMRQQNDKPKVDMSDDDYTLDDLELVKVEVPWEKEVEIKSNDADDDDLSFLDDL